MPERGPYWHYPGRKSGHKKEALLDVKQLPKVISLYNRHMGGVHLLDHKVDQYAGERGFHKYWKKCLFGIIDCMVVCAYILCEQNTSDEPKMPSFPIRV